MAKDLEFKEYSATTEDDDGDKHTTKVSACVITKETAGREVRTPAGFVTVQNGDVLVETETPGIYDYLSKTAWESTGYGASSSPQRK